MKNVKVCLIIWLVLQLLVIETESRGLLELSSLIDNCVFTSNGHRLCQPISIELHDEGDEIIKSEFDDDYNQYKPATFDQNRKGLKPSKRKLEIVDVNQLIPLITRMNTKRKQSNSNRKDEPKKNLNFQTQGWR